MVQSIEAIREDFLFHVFPGWRYLNVYGATGLLAGLAAAPVEYAWSAAPHQHALLPDKRGIKLTSTAPPSAAAFAKNVAPAFIARAGLRFFAYGQFKRIRDVKREMGTNRWPKWLDIGASGGAAGVVETVVANRLANPMSGFPPLIQLLRHPAKLFFCFGTFGFLTTTFEDTQPPREAWKCAAYAAIAGGFGSVICAAAEGLSGPALWMNAAPRGVCVVGTIIATQVMSSAAVFRYFERIGKPVLHSINSGRTGSGTKPPADAI